MKNISLGVQWSKLLQIKVLILSNIDLNFKLIYDYLLDLIALQIIQIKSHTESSILLAIGSSWIGAQLLDRARGMQNLIEHNQIKIKIDSHHWIMTGFTSRCPIMKEKHHCFP